MKAVETNVSGDKRMAETGVLGGVCTAHAPQLWTLPESEDKATVTRVKTLLGDVGAKLRALKPDVCIAIGNDHANQFLLHCTAAFTVHIGHEAKGSFAGRSYSYPVAGEAALNLVRHVQRNGFDPAFTSNAQIDYAFGIPLDFCGWEGPVLPVFVNAYVPPQPDIERCFAFGRALADGIKAQGLRAIVICSGGLSHYPGTERYVEPGPDTDFDRRFMEIMGGGDVRHLLSLDERRLDETGNIELRCWGVAIGLIGERKPDLSNFEPTWHHNYGTLAWTSPPQDEPFVPHYPPIHPDRVVLSDTLHRLANDAAERERYLADPRAYAAGIDGLTDPERDALVTLDQSAMIDMGVHPFVPHAFRRVLERAGLREAPAPRKP
jgi:2,3-dihydroxyphenylpropionate 1,2-dioxygenase